MKGTNRKYLEAANKIGIAICRDAIWSGDRCTWISSIQEHLPTGPNLYYQSTNSDFYSGLSGIAFFLGNLSRFSGEPLFMETSEGAIRQALATREQVPEGSRLSFYVGWTGLAYVLIKLGKELDHPEWANKGEQVLNDIIQLDIHQDGTDVIGGIAGAIPALIEIREDLPRQSLAQFIRRLGVRLLEIGKEEEFGWSDSLLQSGKQNLTGFAHGTAGFIYALLAMYRFTEEEKYLEEALQALEYENNCFDAEEKNWPDLRDLSEYYGMQGKAEENAFGMAWCHGAPGIGLSRLYGFALSGDSRFEEDLQACLNTTMEKTGKEMMTGHCLCHGSFGNAELILSAHTLLKEPMLLNYARAVGDEAIEKYLKKDIPLQNGSGTSFFIPDFMTGAAGMGYYFLRLYAPAVLPSTLAIGMERAVKKPRAALVNDIS